MQTKGVVLASGMPRFVPVATSQAARSAAKKGDIMSNTASSFGHVPSATLFGRFMASLDRLLMAGARAANRNGDLPYFGL
ncbi:MAG: hypothetical protein NVSMB20_13360 [Bradyrhizobium sp.]